MIKQSFEWGQFIVIYGETFNGNRKMNKINRTKGENKFCSKLHKNWQEIEQVTFVVVSL